MIIVVSEWYFSVKLDRRKSQGEYKIQLFPWKMVILPNASTHAGLDIFLIFFSILLVIWVGKKLRILFEQHGSTVEKRDILW